jgi:hypothetical protein
MCRHQPPPRRTFEADWRTAWVPLPIIICALSACGAPTATTNSTGQIGGGRLTAVYSKASNDYARVRNSDGSFQPETYQFRNGGNMGGPRVDATMDKLGFENISTVLADRLSSQNYLLSEDPATTKLLIVVYWGTTLVPDDLNPKDTRSQKFHPEDYLAMEASQDARADAASANLLGYTDEIFRTAPRDPKLDTLKDEIEQDRYYVVLLAYDYQLARTRWLHKLLWETRFSIPEPGNDFETAFPRMASIASIYFGENSHGLIHHDLGEAHVEIGEPKSLGTLPEK